MGQGTLSFSKKPRPVYNFLTGGQNMNIKSLLLGSAAALVAVTGAQAADAIVYAEPEPLEYVRVCDAFGTGYFYIPGTETCLRIGGYVRYDMRGGDLYGLDTNGDGDGDAWAKNTRFAFRTYTASDTELGTLRTYTETRFNYNGFTNTTSLNHGYIELGGFRVGVTDSVYTTWTGFAGPVINDDLVPFGPFQTNLMSYTIDAGNGFSAIVALEDDRGGGEGYMPDLVGGIGYDAGAFQARVVGGYDESIEEGGIKARLDATFGGFSAFVMGGYNTGNVSHTYAPWAGDWAVWGGLSAPVTETISANLALSYDDGETFAAAANLQFTVVPGFQITTEVGYRERDVLVNNVLVNRDQWGGQVRFQRSF
jgi:hypothetical protein